MAEACSPEIDPYLRRTDKMLSTSRIWQKSHHEILQKPPGMLKLHECSFRRVRRLLKENRITCYFRDVDWYRETLACENGIHHGYILMRKVAADRKNKNSRCEEHGRGISARIRRARCIGRNCRGGEDVLLIDVCESEAQRAGHRRCGGQGVWGCTVEESSE